MSDISSGIAPISIRVEPMSSAKSDLIPMKINGLQNLFAPSGKPALPAVSNMDTSAPNPALVVHVFAKRRPENTSLGNPEHATVYHIELDALESLDTNEESSLEDAVDPIDDEMDEKDDSEEAPAFADNRPFLQDGDFLNEEEQKEAFYEMMKAESVSDQTAKKMWQKARQRLLESQQKNRKTLSVSLIRSNSVSYFFLLSQ